MNKFLGMLVLALFGVSAQATVFVGDLHAKKVMCFRAPCPLIVTFTSGGLKPFAVKVIKGTPAAGFLNLIRISGKRETHVSVTIEGQIERENTILADNITRTENEAPAPVVGGVERTWTGSIEAQRVMCNRAPCPAPAVFANEKGIKYQLGVKQGSAAERFMDKLNSTMMGNTAHLKVRVIGVFDGRSRLIRASKIEVIK